MTDILSEDISQANDVGESIQDVNERTAKDVDCAAKKLRTARNHQICRLLTRLARFVFESAGPEVLNGIISKHIGHFAEVSNKTLSGETNLVLVDCTDIGLNSLPNSLETPFYYADVPLGDEAMSFVSASGSSLTWSSPQEIEIATLREQFQKANVTIAIYTDALEKQSVELKKSGAVAAQLNILGLPDTDILQYMAATNPQFQRMIEQASDGDELAKVLQQAKDKQDADKALHDRTVEELNDEIERSRSLDITADKYRTAWKEADYECHYLRTENGRLEKKVHNEATCASSKKLTAAKFVIESLKAEKEQLVKEAHDETNCAASKKLAAARVQLTDKEEQIQVANLYFRQRETKMKDELETQDRQLAEKQKELDAAKRDVKKARDELEAQAMRSAEEYDKISTEFDVMKLEYEADMQKITKLEQKVKRYSDAIEKHKVEYTKLKESRDTLKTEKEGSDQKIFNLEREIQKLSELVPYHTDKLDEHVAPLFPTHLSSKDLSSPVRVESCANENNTEVLEHVPPATRPTGRKEWPNILESHQPNNLEARRKELEGRCDELESKMNKQADDHAHTQQAILTQLEEERTQRERVQEKLGRMMAASIAHGLELP